MKKSIVVIMLVFLVLTITQASFKYQIDYQREILEVSTSGKILLDKSFSFRVLPESTEKGTDIWVGLPTKQTSVTYARYLKDGVYTSLEYKVRTSGDNYNVVFKDFPSLSPGENIEIQFYAEIPDLIYWLDKSELDKDLKDQKVSLSYIPAWWEKGIVKELIVEFRFAPKIDINKIGFEPVQPHMKEQLYNMAKASYSYQNLPANSKAKHAIILPRGYFQLSFEPEKDWLSSSQIMLIVSVIGVIVFIIVGLIALAYKQARYTTPAAYMTGKEAYTDFDPVETALFFSVPGDLLIRFIIMGLIDKNVVKIVDGNQLKKEPTLERLKWYEEIFLESIDDQVKVKKEKWSDFNKRTFEGLKKMLGGYCGAQTKAYYVKLLNNLTSNENLDSRWLLLKDYLDRKVSDETIDTWRYQPNYLNAYMPLFYLSFINSGMEKERRESFNSTFISNTNSGTKTGGSGCACACACACASSGGCT